MGLMYEVCKLEMPEYCPGNISVVDRLDTYEAASVRCKELTEQLSRYDDVTTYLIVVSEDIE